MDLPSPQKHSPFLKYAGLTWNILYMYHNEDSTKNKKHP